MLSSLMSMIILAAAVGTGFAIIFYVFIAIIVIIVIIISKVLVWVVGSIRVVI